MSFAETFASKLELAQNVVKSNPTIIVGSTAFPWNFFQNRIKITITENVSPISVQVYPTIVYMGLDGTTNATIRAIRPNVAVVILGRVKLLLMSIFPL